jgi:hypothetical protein
MIPPATIQGEVWVGNVPVSVYASSTYAQLQTFAMRLELNASRKAHCLKNTITERDLVHQPYGSYSIGAVPPTYPLDERVSYIIYGPSAAGTISGAAPLTWTLELNAYANYTWVPIPQPQVTTMVNSTVNKEVKLGATASPDDKNGAGNTTGTSSIQTEVMPDFKNFTDSDWDAFHMNAHKKLGLGDDDITPHGKLWSGLSERFGKAIAGAKSTAEAIGYIHKAMGDGARNNMITAGPSGDAASSNANYLAIPNFSSQVEDLRFFLARINSSWGDLSSYLPAEISVAATALVDQISALYNLMKDATVAFSEVRKKFKAGHQEYYSRGRKVCDHIAEGVSIADWIADLRKVKTVAGLLGGVDEEKFRIRGVSNDSNDSRSFSEPILFRKK